MTKTDQKPDETAIVPAPHGGVPALRDAMMPQSFEQVLRFAEMVARTSFAPQAYRGKPDEIVAAVTYGAELGFSPMQSLRSIAVINGSPAVWGDGLLAVCQAHPRWAGKEEWLEGQGAELKAVCRVSRKGEPDVISEFSVADATQAGLAGKSGTWQQYTKRMLQMRARGFALRDQFADALRGIISAEEATDMPAYGPEHAKDVTPQDEAPARGSRLDQFAAKHAKSAGTEAAEPEPDNRAESPQDEQEDPATTEDTIQDEIDASAGSQSDDDVDSRQINVFKADGRPLRRMTVAEFEAWLGKAPPGVMADLLEQNADAIATLPEIRQRALRALVPGEPS